MLWHVGYVIRYVKLCNNTIMVACLHHERDNLLMINCQHEHMSFKAT